MNKQSYSVLSDGLLDDPEFIQFLEQERFAEALLWVLMINKKTIGDRCGLFPLRQGIRQLNAVTYIPVETITSALNRFNELGWVTILDDYCWIRNRIGYNSNSPKWMKGALGEVQGFVGRTPLAQQCLDYYASAIERQPDADPTPIERQPNTLTESESESKTESESEHAAKPRMRRVKPAAPDLASAIEGLPPSEWAAFVAMVAGKRKGGVVAESVLVGLAQDVKRKCKGLHPSAIAHGLNQATIKQADNSEYVRLAAASWHPTPIDEALSDRDKRRLARAQADAADERLSEEARQAAREYIAKQGLQP